MNLVDKVDTMKHFTQGMPASQASRGQSTMLGARPPSAEPANRSLQRMSTAADERLVDDSQTQQADMQLVTTQGTNAHAWCGLGQQRHPRCNRAFRGSVSMSHLVWHVFSDVRMWTLHRAELL